MPKPASDFAFPFEHKTASGIGLSVREWYATMAMQALVQACGRESNGRKLTVSDEEIAKKAFDLADAMLNA